MRHPGTGGGGGLHPAVGPGGALVSGGWGGPGRLAPAHICPLTETLVRRGIPFTAVAGGRRVGSWLPFAASDR